MKRILGEANARENNFKGRGNSYHCTLNLSEILGSLPMTIDQEDIMIEAAFNKGNLNLMVCCGEWITPENPEGGIYAIEEDDELFDQRK